MKRFAVLLAVTALVAWGQEKGRQFDFTQVLTGATGQPIREAKDGPPMTLGDAAVTALLTITETDRNVTGAEKFRRDRLARRVYQVKAIVLPVEEIALIKERIGIVFAPAVVGAAWRLLDPATVGPEAPRLP